MNFYNNENTKVLATHKQGDNKRVLLFHESPTGRREYIIGSYFQMKLSGRWPLFECHECGNFERGDEIIDYSWDWGHYFSDIDAAMSYWWREVTGPQYDENTCPHCGSSGGLILEEADDFEAPRTYWFRCEDCGRLSKQTWSLTENEPVEG